MQFKVRKQWRGHSDIAYWKNPVYYSLEIVINGKWFTSNHQYSSKSSAKRAALNIGCCEEIQ